MQSRVSKSPSPGLNGICVDLSSFITCRDDTWQKEQDRITTVLRALTSSASRSLDWRTSSVGLQWHFSDSLQWRSSVTAFRNTSVTVFSDGLQWRSLVTAFSDTLVTVFSVGLQWQPSVTLQGRSSVRVFGDGLQWQSTVTIFSEVFSDSLQERSSVVDFHDGLQWHTSMMVFSDGL